MTTTGHLSHQYDKSLLRCQSLLFVCLTASSLHAPFVFSPSAEGGARQESCKEKCSTLHRRGKIAGTCLRADRATCGGRFRRNTWRSEARTRAYRQATSTEFHLSRPPSHQRITCLRRRISRGSDAATSYHHDTSHQAGALFFSGHRATSLSSPRPAPNNTPASEAFSRSWRFDPFTALIDGLLTRPVVTVIDL